jgi:phosphate transport system substrate-binding protein
MTMTKERGRRRWGQLAPLAAAALVAACASSPPRESRTLRLGGSDTMLRLAERWAVAFMDQNPGVVVNVEGGGTASGVQALIGGRADLATGSRPLLPEEVRELAARTSTVGVSIRCARDGLSVYLNPANPVRDLGLPSVKGIFSGRIGSWHKLGGPEAPIHVVIQPPNSGTHRFFRDLVLHEEPFSERAAVLPTTQAVVDAVRNDPHAIGFGGVAFGPDLVHCSIGGEPPTPENVRGDAYPLTRYLYLHAVRPPRGLAQRFVDFVLGAEGQSLVEEVGFVPLWERATLPRPPGGLPPERR